MTEKTHELEGRSSQLPGQFAVLSAANLGLLGITAVMLMALFTGTDPHPPNRIPLFALAPFLGMSLAVGLFAMVLASHAVRLAWVPSVVFAATGVLSFGPQKLFDPAFHLIWPSVIGAQVFIAIILIQCYALARNRKP